LGGHPRLSAKTRAEVDPEKEPAHPYHGLAVAIEEKLERRKKKAEESKVNKRFGHKGRGTIKAKIAKEREERAKKTVHNRKVDKIALRKAHLEETQHTHISTKRVLSTAQRLLIFRTGLSPLEFLCFVYRDYLFEDYEPGHLYEGSGLPPWIPKPDAKKIDVTIDQRIQAAVTAAPYLHSKMPIGIQRIDAPPVMLDQAKLASLPPAELDALLNMFAKLGVSEDIREIMPVGDENVVEGEHEIVEEGRQARNRKAMKYGD